MIMLNYTDGIHTQSGKEYEIVKDIIVTPFWTEEFCKNLVDVAVFYEDYFTKNIEFNSYSEKQLGWDDLKLDLVSPVFFKQFTEHYRQDISPILRKAYSNSFGDVTGWFSPYIIKYDQIGQKSDIHHDVSHVTFNIKLNSDYTGCDLYFPRQEFNSDQIPVGYAMIWPSTVTHPHGSTELISGKKYSFVSWSWPPEWNREGIKND